MLIRNNKIKKIKKHILLNLDFLRFSRRRYFFKYFCSLSKLVNWFVQGNSRGDINSYFIPTENRFAVHFQADSLIENDADDCIGKSKIEPIISELLISD